MRIVHYSLRDSKILAIGIGFTMLLLSVTGPRLMRAALGEETSVEEASGEDTTISPDADLRRGVKPTRIRKEQRDQLKAESAMREQVGRYIDGSCEQLSEQGQECNFAALKEEAISRLGFGVARLYDEEEDQTQADQPQLGCFDSGGNVTSDRSACAPDQSGFFGMIQDEEESDEWSEEFDEDFDLSDQYVPASYQYSTPSDDEMMQYYTGKYGGHGPSMPMDAGHGMAPDLSMMGQIMDMMGKMLGKLPTLFSIFEREGVTVPPESRAGAESITALYREKNGACRQGDMDACMALGQAASGMEPSMRPPMERAMMQAVMSGKISQSRIMAIGMEIETLMSEGMPPGPMHNGFGPPPGYGPQSGGNGGYPPYGGQGGFGPQGY